MNRVAYDNYSKPIADASLLLVLQERQRRVTSRIPSFSKVVVFIALACFIVSLLSSVVARNPTDGTWSVALENLSLSSFIAFILGLFSRFIVWLFVIISLVFVPYMTYQAHHASRYTVGSVATRPFRWVQLYAATFLPMAVFATTWMSFANEGTQEVSIKVASFREAMVIAILAALVVLALLAINHWIPIRLAAFRISFLSILLYSSLFLAYGLGWSFASHSMVFGILIYLTFGSSQFSDLARRVSLYDIDPILADRFEELATRHDQVKTIQDETNLKRKENETEIERQKLTITLAQTESEVALGSQLADVKKRKVELNRKMNEVQLLVLEKKIETMGSIFDVLSAELQSRMGSGIREKIDSLRERVKNMEPTEIGREMTSIYLQLNAGLDGIPETLTELRQQLLDTTNELERQTQLLADGTASENSSLGNETGPRGKGSDEIPRPKISRTTQP